LTKKQRTVYKVAKSNWSIFNLRNKHDSVILLSFHHTEPLHYNVG